MAAERQGKLSFDKEWSYRLIYYYFKIYRARLLWERKQKKQPHSRQVIQTIPCVSLIQIDMNECPCKPETGCFFLKSKYAIPKSIFGNYISVTSTLGNKTYDYVRWDTFSDVINSYIKAERTKPYYTIKDFGMSSFLYIYSDNNKEQVAITLIADDPLEVIGFPNCDKENHICNPMDELFPVEAESIPIIYEMMFDKMIKIKATAQPELFNNEEPDTSKKP